MIGRSVSAGLWIMLTVLQAATTAVAQSDDDLRELDQGTSRRGHGRVCRTAWKPPSWLLRDRRFRRYRYQAAASRGLARRKPVRRRGSTQWQRGNLY